jgi:uncharacterized membrane protein YcaP (DUF421 family)
MDHSEYTFDLVRIFWGDQPPLFFLEILLRTVVLFAYMILLMRVMGQRGVGQMSLFEFALIIALGSAAGDPTYQKDVPILYGMFVIFLIVMMHKLITKLNQRWRLSQKATEGHSICLVRDGVVDISGLKKCLLAPDELLLEFRKAGARYLEEIDRAYFETDGSVSVFKKSGEGVGQQSLLPEDQEGPGGLSNRLEREIKMAQV